jgi:transcriptional regulator with XRE-family HTH domain
VVSDAIRAERLRQGLSQEELARRTGLHRNSISAIERGRRNIGLESLVKITRALGIRPADLFEG